MNRGLETALQDLLAGMDDDHQRVARVLNGEQAPPPVDAGLAALAAELRRLRWLEPEAPAMALLADAAAQHAEAVEGHLAWLASSPTGPGVIVLADAAVKQPTFRLAS